jgi:hypothetical protein
MSESTNDITKKITKWIQDQGYPLEMEVASIFQSHGFTVGLSDKYEDPDSKESREIDVTAIKWSDLEKDTALQVSWSIECKLARDKPWVIFFASSQPEHFFPIASLCSPSFRPKLIDVYKQEKYVKRLKDSEIINPRYVGHGVTQAFTSGQDIPYKATMSSMKAAIDRVRQFEEISKIKTVKGPSKFWVISFPTVVIDGKLFSCILGEEKKPIVIEIGYGVLYWKSTVSNHSTTYVYILTKRYLEYYVKQAIESANLLCELVD